MARGIGGFDKAAPRIGQTSGAAADDLGSGSV
jgi:hypothetical protein